MIRLNAVFTAGIHQGCCTHDISLQKTPGFSMLRSTCDSAAKLTTMSGCSSSKSLSTAALSQISACTKRKLGLSNTGAKVDKLPAYVSLSRQIMR